MTETSSNAPLPPPDGHALLEAPGDWLLAPPGDPAAAYVSRELWAGGPPAAGWQIARFSAAAYLYREVGTGHTFVAKFYSAKTGDAAEQFAGQEHRLTQRARSAGLDAGDLRAVEPLGVWRGVLFLEHVDGLTLEDTIAVRRSRPGSLLPALELTAKLLARLHRCAEATGFHYDFPMAVDYARRLVDNLATHGVLQDNPVVTEGLSRAVDRWAKRPEMAAYEPAFTHGDATTTNFIFPTAGGVVALDLERAKVTDPAADLGRLIAEVSHATTRFGGTEAEAEGFTRALCDAYIRESELPEPESLAGRVRFHTASSTLRIARNGWLPREERLALAAKALALLA